jgi:hypothetical protein
MVVVRQSIGLVWFGLVWEWEWGEEQPRWACTFSISSSIRPSPISRYPDLSIGQKGVLR